MPWKAVKRCLSRIGFMPWQEKSVLHKGQTFYLRQHSPVSYLTRQSRLSCQSDSQGILCCGLPLAAPSIEALEIFDGLPSASGAARACFAGLSSMALNNYHSGCWLKRHCTGILFPNYPRFTVSKNRVPKLPTGQNRENSAGMKRKKSLTNSELRQGVLSN